MQRQPYGAASAAWMAEAREIQPGVHLARVVLSDEEPSARIRVLNLGEDVAVLAADHVIGDLHPVEVEVFEPSESSEEVPSGFAQELLTGIDEEVPPETRERLGEARLKLKPSKCRLLRRTVAFLGHVVSGDGISVEPEKVREVAERPVPQQLREVRACIGLCSYYRKFIRSFSTIAAPLFGLTRKGQTFVWTPECQQAFDRMKEALTSIPILALPHDDAVYTLDCDACDVGIGAVLSQEIDGHERVIAYGSRLLSDAERNYCVTRKELLAVVHFTQLYPHYFLGSRFTLRTAPAALRWLQRTPEPIGQQARWLEKLAEYEFVIVHRAGARHGNAHPISRKPCRQCGRGQQEVHNRSLQERGVAHNETVSTADLASAQKDDPILSRIRGWVDGAENVPSLVEILGESELIKVYWHQRDQLHLREDVLYRKTSENL